MKIEIWSRRNKAPENQNVFIWNGYLEKNGQSSVLKSLEENSARLRSIYLGFVCEIGKLKIRGKRIVEHLELESGFNLWWMSLPVEKSIFKSPGILNALRLCASGEELSKQSCETLKYVGDNGSVAESFRNFCEQRKILFVYQKEKEPSQKNLLRRIWVLLPDTLKSLAFLGHYLLKHWKLKKSKPPVWFSSSDSVFFFSYFIHLDRQSCQAGRFYSKQWEVLPKILNQQGKQLNWLHLFLFSSTVPDTTMANRWLRLFNKNADVQGNHAFLDTFLGWEVIRKVLRDWLLLQIRHLWLGREMEQPVSTLSEGWLWPTLREDWQGSVIGTTVMQNLLWIHLFDKAMSEIPHQRLGLYLCENQGWERAFIFAWRKHGHGNLVGVAHSTISYWDLRYFDQCDAESSDIMKGLPQPDRIAVNGPAAWKILEQAGQKMTHYVQVEALRYLYLNDLNTQSRNSVEQKHKKRERFIFLCLGDIKHDTTHRMLSKVEQAFPNLNKYDIWIKPHPANPVDLDSYPKLQAKLTSRPLSELLSQADLALASALTSSALETFCAGIPVINYLDPYDLNFSPLRGIQGAKFINSAEELIEAMEQIETGKWQKGKPGDFFWLDSDLPRWENLLELDPRKENYETTHN